MMSSSPNKILLIRLSALGDIVQTLPILSVLRNAYPGAHIGWVADEDLAEALIGHPGIDSLYLCPRKRWRKAAKNPLAWPAILREIVQFILKIRQGHYEASLDLQGLLKTALIPFLAGIPRRIGYGHGREASRFFYTEIHGDGDSYFDPAILHYRHMFDLASALAPPPERAALFGSPEDFQVQLPPVPEKIELDVAAWLSKLANVPIVAISPATQWPSKHWPVSSWQVFIRKILEETHCSLVFIGGKGDKPLVDQLLRDVPETVIRDRVVNLAGRTSIPALQVIYRRVAVAVGPDSAPLHIAAATGIPAVVGLYGPTGARRTPPLGRGHIRVLTLEGQLSCQPCHKKMCPLGTLECLHRLSPEDVYQVVRHILSQQAHLSDASPGVPDIALGQ